MKHFKINAQALKSISLPVNLQRRDKIALAIAAGALVIFLVFQWIIFPIIDRRTHLRSQIRSRTLGLSEMQELQAEYRSLSQYGSHTTKNLKQRPSGFTLFSFIDRLAGQSGLKGNIAYMKPSTSNLKNSPYSLSMVEMKLNSLTMDQLTNFLHGIEDPTRLVWIRRISITKGEKNQGLLSTVLQVETFQQ